MPWSEFFGVINEGLLVLILVRGVWCQLLSHYRVFYAYIGYVLITSIMVWSVVAFIGMRTWDYYYAYHISALFYPLFQLWLLWEIYREITGSDRAARAQVVWLLGVVIVVTLPIAWDVFQKTRDYFNGYDTVMLPAQMVGCILVYFTALRRRVKMGGNRKGLLVGLSLMVGLQAINHIRYFVGEANFGEFAVLVPLIYTMALSIFLVSHWNYYPLRQRE